MPTIELSKEHYGPHIDESMQSALEAFAQYEFPIVEACFGHLNEHSEIGRGDSFPAITMFIAQPNSQPGTPPWLEWYEKVTTTCEEMSRLLNEYYCSKSPAFDSRLTVYITRYRTRAIYVESIGAQVGHFLLLPDQRNALNRYRNEISGFIEYLRTKPQRTQH